MLDKSQADRIAVILKENLDGKKFILMVIDPKLLNVAHSTNASVMSNVNPDEIPFFLNEFLDECPKIKEGLESLTISGNNNKKTTTE